MSREDLGHLKLPALATNLVAQFREKGFKFFWRELHSSCLFPDFIPEISVLLNGLGDHCTDLGLRWSEKSASFENHRLGIFVTQDAAEHFVRYTIDKQVGGQMLDLYVPFHHIWELEKARTTIDRTIFALRTFFGSQAAHEHKLASVGKLENDKWMQAVYTPKYAESLPLFFDQAMDSIGGDAPSELYVTEAAANLAKLIEIDTPQSIRFLLRWTALEAQLTHLPGNNSGLRRGHFANEELKSSAISGELRRLHIVRSAFLKEGKMHEVRKYDDFMLQCMLRLSMLPSCDTRRRLIDFTERVIVNGSDAVPAHLLGHDVEVLAKTWHGGDH